jgi:hypothetical protein
MSNIMSDMKVTKPGAARKTNPTPPDTFTVRDMSRNAAAVLSASLIHGQVRIRSRNGPAFLLMPEKATELMQVRAKAVDDFELRQQAYREQLRRLGSRSPSRKDLERINRIIAGEE